MSGVHALVRFIVDQMRMDRAAGLNTATFVSGYEGSPLAGLDLELARNQPLLREHNIEFKPGVNEELAATAVAGSQTASSMPECIYDGVLGIWYGKAPGLDRASDAIRHGNFAGSDHRGGAVLLVGDDPTSKSSSIPSSSDMTLKDLGIPTLYPGTQREIIELGLHAVALSRMCGAWVALKIVTDVADAWMDMRPDRVELPSPNQAPSDPDRPPVTGLIAGPARLAAERTLFGKRLELAATYSAAHGLNRIVQSESGDKLGIVAAGKTYYDLLQAFAILGLDMDSLRSAGVRLMQVRMVYPLESTQIVNFAQGLREILVLEEKRPFLEATIRDLLYGEVNHPVVSGKTRATRDFVPVAGALDPDAIADLLAPVLVGAGLDVAHPRVTPRPRTHLPLLARTPYFCSGCPHNRSAVVPGDALVGAGIGCHALVTRMPDLNVGRVSGMTQMGGEGAQWIGMAPFLAEPHLFQNIGDGTFTHSGSLAIRAAVAAGANITFKLLYNDAVAMTGGQVPTGRLAVPQIVKLLQAEGVSRITITTEDPRRYRGVRLPKGVKVLSRDRIVEAQEQLASVHGVTVLIHDQACAAELRRKRKRGLAPNVDQRVIINERVCEGCGDCGEKSNCLSVEPVETEYGRKTRIHQGSCNQDFSCLEGDCPAFISVNVVADTPKRAPRFFDDTNLPEPEPIVPDRRFAVRICGIGGTGIVTMARILGTAAILDGRHALGLDMTGLAQKGGPVTSDVIISADPHELMTKVTADRCDTYIAADVLVGAETDNLKVMDPARTVAVISRSEVPTGAMVGNVGVHFPPSSDTVERILDRARRNQSLSADVRATLNAWTGSDAAAPVVLLGMAYQQGALPLTSGAFKRAIEMNGVEVAENIYAFKLGRLMAMNDGRLVEDEVEQNDADSVVRPLPAYLASRIASIGAGCDEELDRLLRDRCGELVQYQGSRYAMRYLNEIEAVAAEEQRLGSSRELTRAVVRYLFKLMAYKDEYEVARLSLLPEVDAKVRKEFGRKSSYSWQLHPPVLRALGMSRKISLGPWFRYVFRILYMFRWLRGTRLDPFGYARVRRMERSLIQEYCASLLAVRRNLRADTHAVCLEIARSPDLVRGYEDVKLRSVEVFREKLSTLTQRLSSVPTD